MNEEIIKKSNEIYSNKANKYPFTSRAVSWDDMQSQYFRFHEILKHISFEENVKILDIGCGNAELFKFLNFSGFKGTYTGIDVNDDLLSQAKELYKGIDVQNINILKDHFSLEFDYVVISGLFNMNYGQDLDWTKQMIAKSFKLATKKFIFNAISSHVNFKQEEMFYINPSEILTFILDNLSSNVILEHGKIPYNFLICAEKVKNWESISRNNK